MSIVKEFIDKNAELLKTMSEDNPELSASIVEALGILGNFIEQKNVAFTDEEKNLILTSAEPIEFKPKVVENVVEEVKAIENMVETSKETLQPANGEYIVREVLRLDEISDLDNPIKSNNFTMFWKAIKEQYYGNSESNMPSQGYDKLFVKIQYSGRAKDMFQRERLDIGLGSGDFNPFQSPNIFFDEQCRNFCHKVMFLYFGFKDVKHHVAHETYFNYFLSNAIVLFNFEMGVSDEYFGEQLIFWTKKYFNSDYWNEQLVKMRDNQLSMGANSKYDNSDEIRKRFRKMQTYTYTEIKEILREFVPKEWYAVLFENVNGVRKLVRDLAWLTPNEDNDLEYMKKQLGMPYDFSKAFWEEGKTESKEATTNTAEEGLEQMYEITNSTYETDNMPSDIRDNNLIKDDLLKEGARLCKLGNVRFRFIEESGNIVSFVMIEISTNEGEQISVIGNSFSFIGSKDDVIYRLSNLIKEKVVKVEIEMDSGLEDRILGIIFENLNQKTTQKQPAKRGRKPKATNVTLPPVAEKNDVFLEAEDDEDEDVSAEDIESLDTIGEIEDEDDFSLLEDLLK